MVDQKKRRTLGAQFIKLENEGETFVGTLQKREPMTVQGNSTFRYTFENGDGRFAMVGTRQLDDALGDAEIGLEVEIVFERLMVMDSGNELKIYTVSALE